MNVNKYIFKRTPIKKKCLISSQSANLEPFLMVGINIPKTTYFFLFLFLNSSLFLLLKFSQASVGHFLYNPGLKILIVTNGSVYVIVVCSPSSPFNRLTFPGYILAIDIISLNITLYVSIRQGFQSIKTAFSRIKVVFYLQSK